jgi:DNA mismatch repair protein MutS
VEILAEIAEQEQEEKPVPKQGSPMYQHYMSIQAQYPDSIIAYRLGDFYEVFGDNAVKIAEELDLTLTGRDCGLDERVPMVGFPYHAADVYIAKIVQRGYKIAVAEDLNTVREIAVDKSETIIDADTGEVISDTPTPRESETDILAHEREIAKAFDKEALIKLSDLLGNIFTLG